MKNKNFSQLKILFLLISSTIAMRIFDRDIIITDEIDAKYFTDDFIESLNARNDSTWTAGRNFDESTPLEHLRGLLGTNLWTKDYNTPYRIVDLQQNIPLPRSFDSRNHWPKCRSIGEIPNQGSCGSCWAVVAAQVLTDRYCIHANVQTTLSAEDLLECCVECAQSCKSGHMHKAWLYLQSNGTVTGGSYGSKLGCKPYLFSPCGYSGSLPKCQKNVLKPGCVRKCTVEGFKKPYDQDKQRTQGIFRVPPIPEAIQHEIYHGGPVQAGFYPSKDFYHYRGGVYQSTLNTTWGGHSVKIIGWGEENGIQYWLGVNSWGPEWGLGGLFKVKRGSNHLKIEEHVYGGFPV
ncbi:Cathepsin B [Sarcoptes scabiei]|uniref:Cathepsin B n=1 Tax=Sarcoptes scabiei TaxID=52283 RepID=A0A834RFK1_SARSC|nr:Cathepsin B [Sarcoptes scabiei]